MTALYDVFQIVVCEGVLRVRRGADAVSRAEDEYGTVYLVVVPVQADRVES